MIGFYHSLSVNGETTSVQVDANVPQDPQSKCSNQTVDSEGKESGKVNAEKDNRSKSDIQFDKSDISEDQQERFLSMIDDFSDIFAADNSDLEKTSLSEHTIDTGEFQPIKLPPRRIPPHQREIIDR